MILLMLLILTCDPYINSETEPPEFARIYAKCGNETEHQLIADDVELQADGSFRYDIGLPDESCDYKAKYVDGYGRESNFSDPFVLKLKPGKPLGLVIEMPQ